MKIYLWNIMILENFNCLDNLVPWAHDRVEQENLPKQTQGYIFITVNEKQFESIEIIDKRKKLLVQ